MRAYDDDFERIMLDDLPDDKDSSNSFRAVVKGVKPLKNTTKAVYQKNTSKPVHDAPESTLRARRKAAEFGKIEGGAALSDAWIEPTDPEEMLSYITPGVQLSQFQRLKRGQLQDTFEMDLHGYKIDEAREWIYRFIQAARKEGHQVVRIIHGKAHSNKDRQQTLKSHTNHWLKQMSDVLAFCSAPAAGGGTGSVLVLLKRGRQKKNTYGDFGNDY